MEEWKNPILELNGEEVAMDRYLINQQGAIKHFNASDVRLTYATITSFHHPYASIVFLHEGYLLQDFLHRIIWRSFKGGIPPTHDIFYVSFEHGYELSNLTMEEL